MENVESAVDVSSEKTRDQEDTRRMIQCMASVVPGLHVDDANFVTFTGYELLIFIRFEDGMNRVLDCPVEPDEDPQSWLGELLEHRLIPVVS